MTAGRVSAAALVLLLGLAAGAVAAALLLPRADVGAEVAATPGEVAVSSWSEAAGPAGIQLYVPRTAGEPELLTVHGVEGDRTRPIEARYSSGLIVVQAHRDVLPEKNTGALVTVSGADDAWWQTASDGRRLAVRFGDTVVLLSGLDGEELATMADALEEAPTSDDGGEE